MNARAYCGIALLNFALIIPTTGEVMWPNSACVVALKIGGSKRGKKLNAVFAFGRGIVTIPR